VIMALHVVGRAARTRAALLVLRGVLLGGGHPGLCITPG
jgi:hypothetical protein